MEFILTWLFIGAVSYGYIASAEAFLVATDHNTYKDRNTTYAAAKPSLLEILLGSLLGFISAGYAIWVYFDLRKY